MVSPVEKDKNWVNSSFMVTGGELDELDLQNRFFSTASMKFSDTTPGGNFAVNPPPQFTRTADPKARSLFYPNTEPAETLNSFSVNYDSRMGRYYSEAIDDNAQLINMRFGVPKFNSLATFFTSFYNSGAGRLARTGRMSSALYTIGQVAGIAMMYYAPPLLYLHVANFVGTGVRFMMGKPSSKYYYLKPAMPLYWNAVTSIVNHLATLKGITPRIFDGKVEESLRLGESAEDRKEYARVFPDIFDENGQVNVYGLATRAQRKYRKYRELVEKTLDQRYDGMSDARAFIESFARTPLTDTTRQKYTTLQQYVEGWMRNSEGQLNTNNGTGDASDPNRTTEAVEKLPEYEQGKYPEDGFFNFFASELDDGSAFVTFRVNYTGTVSESFSNSATDSEIAGTINSMSSKARSTSFSIADGNISSLVGGALDAVKDVVAGVADSTGLSGIVALAGGAFADIPKHWQSSTAQLARSTYTMNLVSPYGNRMSRFLNIDIPLAMILAGALPLSTGRQSYSSPFLCEIYDKGRCQTRLGIIDSLTINRGTGNLGFNNNGQTMAMEVSFSVMDLSSIVHMPLIEGFTLDPSRIFFDEDTTFSDYMASLAGLGLADQIYPWRKFKINISKARNNWNTYASWQHFANWLGGTTPSQLLSGLYKGTPR